jgi:hypothetical protein
MNEDVSNRLASALERLANVEEAWAKTTARPRARSAHRMRMA